MSMGIGASAHLLAEEEQYVIYTYGGYNLNKEGFENKERTCDGMIQIERTCFAEPIIHEKIKRMPSGRKKQIIKKIPVSVDYEAYILEGRITVENCSTCWKTYTGRYVDIMALKVLHELFRQYQEEECLPKDIFIHI